ncbi:energy-dependent translational throttle protein EttA [Pseudobacteriovorax antillogorgiicola]|uniref:Energy-dependent translational throttle protein EttA n=1 Tax=Pseudobacteriovorax antillogorgiicola TaxID=1513793 RepID=A0A1Y6CEA1_9BACT|nr:energy-dependent translational throttle protein EttA [Pseudobacteriovorax antillogorgiicola]TCS49322.1 ATP-binding cassette ChvD family protein [Pseudobacteriovorax antillogorgiicola]SMF48081.1 ATP-binding cassette protein, ChvD family [Pseudobacteriovorax antillogorgiicola]
MSDKTIIYSMVGVSKTHGTKTVLKDIYLSYFYGAKIGVLGHNGSGKSTLLRILAGVDEEFAGETVLSDGYSIGYLAQEPDLEAGKTVREIVEEGVQEIVDLQKEFEEINLKFAEEMSPEEMDKLIARQSEVQDLLDRHDAWTLDDRLNFAMDALRCPPQDQVVDHLSGGERRRVALCRLLLQKPDILLLDEPTNHLDAESVHWLEKHLQDYKGTIIAVTHDRYFLDNVAGWILELDRGQGIPWKGNYSSWLDQKEKRLAQEAKSEDKRRKNLQQELEWINMSPRARQAKNKARITAYEKLLDQGNEALQKDLQLYIPPGPRLGDVVIEASGVSKSFEDKLLYKDLSFSLPAGGIVGIVGANGTGKTTLFKLITGMEEPDSGSFRVGATAKVGYMEQSRLALDPNKTIYEAISEGQEVIQLGRLEVNARAYVGRFNFTGQDQQKKVGALSGGERNRIQLAMLCKSGANVLLLDEPTNDLDVATLRALEDALLAFGGCAVVISHDRWFLDRVATHILAFEGDSEVYWYEGNYSEYEEDRKRRLGVDSLTPKRVRYAKLER